MTSERVVQRYLAARDAPSTQDEGDFIVTYLPRHREVVEPIAAKLHKAIKMCRGKRLPIKDKLIADLSGKGASHADALYWMGRNPPMIRIAPKAFRDPTLVNTLIHELGHYIHDRVVPGGTSNMEIRSKHIWAVKQRSTGEGPRIDVLKREIKTVEAEKRQLEEDMYIYRPAPRKGQVFDFKLRHPMNRAVTYPAQGKIVKKRGDDIWIEVLSPLPDINPALLKIYRRSPAGNLIINESLKSILYVGVKPDVERKLKELEVHRHELYEEANNLARTEKDDRYKVQRSAWAPTDYSRKNYMEWFAELCTTLVLGHLEKPVEEWLLSVVRTGKAPT